MFKSYKKNIFMNRQITAYTVKDRTLHPDIEKQEQI